MKTFPLATNSLSRRLFTAAALVLSLAGVKGADYPATVLADNPSVYYRFEETSGGTAFNSATSETNSSNPYPTDATIFENGELTSPLLGEPGIDTNSFLFIGPGPGGAGDYGYVDIPESPLITPLAADGVSAAPFSAELWVQPNAYPANWSVPIVQGRNDGGANANGWNVYVSGPGAGNLAGQSYFYLDMRPSVFSGFGDFLISFGSWYHLVLSYDGTNAVFYINSVAHAIPIGPGGFVPNTANDANIGSGQTIGWLPFIGGVDEVAFYTNALTAAQVSSHYTVGTNSFRPANKPAGIVTDLPALTNFSGVPVTFNIAASGTPPLTFTWLSNSVPVGPNADAFTFTAAYPGNNGATVQVIVSNAFGPPVTSSIVTLTVATNVNIASAPGPITRNVGSHAAFHVGADGAIPLSYQWSVSTDNGSTFTPISAATNSTATNETLWLSNVQLAQSGNIYSVTVSDSFASASASASLIVQPRQDPVVPLNGVAAIIAADDPVAYWRLDETGGTLAEDAVGTFDGTYTPNSGTITYGVTSGIPHTSDPAITLAGGATIQVPWAPELNPDTAWTVETWVNPSSLGQNGGDYRLVLSSEYNDQSVGYAYNGWYLYQQPGNNFAFVTQPGNAFITAGPSDPAHGNQLVAGNWYHVVITDDTTNFNIYINGVIITAFPVATASYVAYDNQGDGQLTTAFTTAGAQFIPNGDGINPDGIGGLPSGDNSDDGGNFVIGQRDDGAFGTFLGSVDDTAIYRYALRADQVASHYAAAARLHIAKSGSNVVLTWPAGILQSASSISGIFANVPGAASPYTTSASATTFYRLLVP
ncbi:MAG TPA: LamG domain-containing protein [Verrucomicrobiae bacterium]